MASHHIRTGNATRQQAHEPFSRSRLNAADGGHRPAPYYGRLGICGFHLLHVLPVIDEVTVTERCDPGAKPRGHSHCNDVSAHLAPHLMAKTSVTHMSNRRLDPHEHEREP